MENIPDAVFIYISDGQLAEGMCSWGNDTLL
jgi:hypothetical protein